MSDSPDYKEYSALTAIRALQQTDGRGRLHEREKTLVGLLALTLIFMPWAIGSMLLWAQWVAFGLAVLCFVIAGLPRQYEESFSTEADSSAITRYGPLLKFPVFWIGLLVFLYLIVQHLNPSWAYLQDLERRVWWMEPREHIAWLPSGTESPFGKSSQLRFLLVLSIAWLLVCAVRIGLTRRKSFLALFWLLVVNGMVLSLVGLVQIFGASELILWMYDSKGSDFISSFIYKNHAAAYLNLVLALSLGMAVHYFLQARRKMKRSDPSGFFLFGALLLLLTIIFSLSRMGAILATFLLLVFLSFLFHGFFLQRVNPALRTSGILLLIGLTGLGTYGAAHLDFDAVLKRFERWAEDRPDGSVELRLLTYESSVRMFQDRWIYGWGGGSFRYMYPLYQDRAREAEFTRSSLYWEHAHNDWLQFPVEFGAVGSALLLFCIAYWVIVAWRARFWRNPLLVFLGLGLTATLVHNTIDFNFQNPAVLALWCVFLASLGQLARYDLRRRPLHPRRR